MRCCRADAAPASRLSPPRSFFLLHTAVFGSVFFNISFAPPDYD